MKERRPREKKENPSTKALHLYFPSGDVCSLTLAMYIYAVCKVLYFILSDDDFVIKSKIHSFKRSWDEKKESPSTLTSSFLLVTCALLLSYALSKVLYFALSLK